MFMHSKLEIHSLKAKLLCLTIIPISVILLLVSVFCVGIVKKNKKAEVQQEVYSQVERVSYQITNYFDRNKESLLEQTHLQQLLSVVRAPELDEQQLRALLSNIGPVEGTARKTFAFIEEKQIYITLSNNQLAVEENAKAAKMPWYESGKMSRAEAYVSSPYMSKVDGEENTPCVAVVQAVRDGNGDIYGIYGFEITLASMESFFAESEERDLYSVLVNQNGTVIYTNNHKYLYKHSSELTNFNEISKQIKEGSESGVKEIEIDGRNQIASLFNMERPDWVMLMIMPQNEVNKRMNTIVIPMEIAFVITIILLIGAMSLMAVYIVKPIKKMTEAMKGMETGNYEIGLKVESNDELGELASAMNDTIDTLRYRAEYDPLTGIYNEETLFAEAERLIQSNEDKNYAIIRMDINHFKIINDLFSWSEGDKLLQYVAYIIEHNLNEGSICGHLNSDIFLVCMEYTTKREIMNFINKIKEGLVDYYLPFNLVASFGVYIVEEREARLSSMCDWANLALKTIKGSSLVNYAFYDNQLRNKMIQDKQVESEMEHALSNGEFYIVLQPKCDIVTGKVIGAEALVRWNHPEKGIIPPNSFIPVFEKNGFIVKLDAFVWEETCKIIKKWQDAGVECVPISVNVSRMHIFDVGFDKKLKGLVEKYQIPTSLLELELTESAFLENVSRLYDVMNSLREDGFVLSMDDFGSGYSSLNMLKNVPLDVVKLDREFLNETTTTEKGKTIVESTISMVQRLKMKVVAEGVETKEHANFLLEAGCHIAQGYYYSKPISVDTFEEFAFGKKIEGEV